jgi:regulator of cell morphogenesis and NO signaling
VHSFYEGQAMAIAIESGETLNALVDRLPETLPVLQGFGLDTCCGGALTLEQAAERHGLDLRQLLEALRAAGAPARGAR